jgi:hypothetical protein
MSPIRLTHFAAVPLLLISVMGVAHADALIIDLSHDDPFAPGNGPPRLVIEGEGSGRFLHEPDTQPAHPADHRGSLLARYESTLFSARATAGLGDLYTESDDFLFGAIVTIRSDNLHADPSGFHPITLSLINSATTGLDRTGDPTDFRADTFDSIDIAYFPQESFFGGPFLSPAIFGSPVGDDAFADFSFGSLELTILPGLPHLLLAEHRAAERRMTVTVYALGSGGRPVPLPGGGVDVDLSNLGGFAIDALAITLYEDGFNIFAASGRSLAADLDYELLFFAPGRLGEGGSLPSLEGLIRRHAEGARGLSAR